MLKSTTTKFRENFGFFRSIPSISFILPLQNRKSLKKIRFFSATEEARSFFKRFVVKFYLRMSEKSSLEVGFTRLTCIYKELHAFYWWKWPEVDSSMSFVKNQFWTDNSGKLFFTFVKDQWTKFWPVILNITNYMIVGLLCIFNFFSSSKSAEKRPFIGRTEQNIICFHFWWF